MITEDYVSFETAKLLKEKGFLNGAIVKFFASGYDKDGNVLSIRETELKDYPRPTLQMAMKWIQEIHNIIIVADYDYEFTDTSWSFKVYRLGEHGRPEGVPVKGVSYDAFGVHEHIVGYRDYERSYKDYATREEAEEDGIRYCLKNLI